MFKSIDFVEIVFKNYNKKSPLMFLMSKFGKIKKNHFSISGSSFRDETSGIVRDIGKWTNKLSLRVDLCLNRPIS